MLNVNLMDRAGHIPGHFKSMVTRAKDDLFAKHAAQAWNIFADEYEQMKLEHDKLAKACTCCPLRPSVVSISFS